MQHYKGHAWLPALATSDELIERLTNIKKEVGVNSLAVLRRLALSNFITQYFKDEKFRKEVNQWFKKTTA